MSSTINNLQKLSQHISQRSKDANLLREAKEKVERLEEERYAAVTKVASLEKDLAQLNRCHDALRGDNEDLDKMLTDAEKNVHDLEEELSECVETNKENDGEIRELRQKLDNLRKQLRNDTYEQVRKMKKIKKSVAKTSKENESLVAVNEAKTKRMKEITAQLLKVNADVETMKKENSQRERSMSLAQKRISTVQHSRGRCREQARESLSWRTYRQKKLQKLGR